MTLERIKQTNLWVNSLGESIDDNFKEQREQIRVALVNFRKNAEVLVAQISRALPDLTQHDISHLDALWETASVICGNDYPLNPLEAFVLGGAFLLHDSALCFEAYEGGLEGVRDTVVWRDHYAQIIESSDGEIQETFKSAADFQTLRSLHASQAEQLGEMVWGLANGDQKFYLIENYTLRTSLGKWIGLVAGSHHWPIEDIESRLPNQLNSLPNFPREWRVDLVKIACILRCADAAHIDSERAPDFLHILLNRRGISFHHWNAQNKLTVVDVDQSDETGSTLLYTSAANFKEEDSESWWVAYDTICMIDREIRDANAVLRSKAVKAPEFAIKRVQGVESPELMSKFIKTEGWNPCVAEIHVSNLEGLVRTLGGEKLYGSGADKLEIVLRELIQNSRDAIHARREFDPEYVGKISIKFKTVGQEKWIYIEDDGIGMSKKVLTGPLLDFGTSFWGAALVKTELPGLRSSKFRSIGKFGVGFYSVFMCSNEVMVASKRWSSGAQDIWQLHFKNGLSLRPVLKKSAPKDMPYGASTQVAIRVNQNIVIDPITVRRGRLGASDIQVKVSDYVSAICAGLDVSVTFSSDGEKDIEIHQEELTEANALGWLSDISFARYQDQHVVSYVEEHYGRLRPIIENGRRYGFAAISTILGNDANFLSVNTVGGLATTVHARDGVNYIGYIDKVPESAKRDGLSFSASKIALKKWAEDQIELINFESLNPLERYVAASGLCFLMSTPINIAAIIVGVNKQKHAYSFSELAVMALNTPICFLKSEYFDSIDYYNSVDFIDGVAVVHAYNHGEFLSLEMNEDRPRNSNTILGCLFRAIELNNSKVVLYEKDTSINTPIGRMKMLLVSAENKENN